MKIYIYTEYTLTGKDLNAYKCIDVNINTHNMSMRIFRTMSSCRFHRRTVGASTARTCFSPANRTKRQKAT